MTTEFHVLRQPGRNQRGTSIDGELGRKDAASAAAVDVDVDDCTGVGGGLDFSPRDRLEDRRHNAGGSGDRLKGTREGAGDLKVDADADAEPDRGDQ